MILKYFLGALVTIPCLPILYWQGKRIKKTIPKLGEAQGTEGVFQTLSKRTIRLLTIGESTVAGVGAQSHHEGFTGSLANEIGKLFQTSVHWKVYAKSGFTAQKIHSKMLPLIEEKEVDMIVVGLGANDAFDLNTPFYWKKQIIQLISKIRQKFPHTPIFFMNMPPIKVFPAFTNLMKFSIGNLVEILGDELEKTIQNYDNVFYNSEIIQLDTWAKRYALHPRQVNAFFSDGVHPSVMTYQIWAKDMARFIHRHIGKE